MKGALKGFDIPMDMYADDVSDIVGNCIQRYGHYEWRCAVLTNEIHGHLGIYSTLGAKMGVRAIELFKEKGVGEGEISVVSDAGSEPPVSCLNDGLQVSTGASMGHGLFSLSSSRPARVSAQFTRGSISIALSLKPEYADILHADIAKGVELYGHTPAYWNYVRRLAIKYWQEWDRSAIFQQEQLC